MRESRSTIRSKNYICTRDHKQGKKEFDQFAQTTKSSKMQNTRKLCFEVNAVATWNNKSDIKLPQRCLWRSICGRSSLPIILGLRYVCFTWTPGNDQRQISPSQIKIRKVPPEESRLAGQNQQPHRSSICSVPTPPTIASKWRLSRSPWHTWVPEDLASVSPWTQAIYWSLA